MSYEIDGRTNGPAITWPGRARIAVMVTFDFDAEYLRMSRAASKGTTIGFTDYSRGQYGPREGLKRCLDMLDTHDIKSTFFVPGIVAENTLPRWNPSMPEAMKSPVTAICMNPSAAYPRRKKPKYWKKARLY